MQPIGVLARKDPFQDRRRVEVIGQRKLHQKRIDLRIGIQLVDKRLDLMLGGGGRKSVVIRPNPGLDRVAVLDAHIGLRRRVIADEERGESHPLAHLSERTHATSHLSTKQGPGLDARQDATLG